MDLLGGLILGGIEVIQVAPPGDKRNMNNSLEIRIRLPVEFAHLNWPTSLI